MWKCPRCGREFKNQGQDHYCGTAPATIDEYIHRQPGETHERLRAVRSAIHEAIPEAVEKISWSMPTFWQGRNLIQFAAFRKHTGVYPGPEAVEHFAEELKEYKTSKGAIQFPHDRPIPLELIARIAKWCQEREGH